MKCFSSRVTNAFCRIARIENQIPLWRNGPSYKHGFSLVFFLLLISFLNVSTFGSDDVQNINPVPSAITHSPLQTQSILPRVASDDGSQIDIMIVYTPAARREAGGEAGMEEAIRIAIDNTNQIFERSLIPTRLRLVYQQEVSYVEKLWYYEKSNKWLVDDHADRKALVEKSDGEMDAIHPLRDLYGADMVCLLNTGAGSSSYNQPFFVAQWKGARDDDVFQHEMGHCFGCAHAVGDTWSGDPPGCAQGAGIYRYSHGWHLFIGNQRYSTIMAYHTANYRFPTESIKIPYFSNPDVLYQGIPTGRPVGVADEANNALTIAKMAPTVAKWRTAVTSPEPPLNVIATKGSSEKVTLTWNKVLNGTHYRIFRSEQETDYPIPISSWQHFPTAVYHDTSGDPFKMYYYFVKAAKSTHGTLPSGLSDPSVGWRKLPPPASIRATDGTTFKHILVSWDRVEKATHYRVWRSGTKDGEKQQITEWIAGLSFQDNTVQPLSPYYYWIQSCDISHSSMPSNFSEADSGWCDLAPPAVTASDGDFSDKIRVSWKAQDGASYYRVYRSDSAVGEKTPVSGWQTALSFNDTTAIAGNIYYYWLRCATNSFGIDGTDYSESDRGWRVLETPSGLKASDGTSTESIRISWNVVPGNAQYRVYRKESPTGTPTAIGAWLNQTEYEDAGIQPGKLYYYSIKAMSRSAPIIETAFSNTDEGWRALLPPAGVKAADGVSPSEIRVEWEGVWGANVYRVYRANNWKGDNKTAITGWISQRFYVDKQVSAGDNYYYWIEAAVDAQGTRASAFSIAETGSAGLVPPENVVASKGENFVTVTWKAATGAKYYRVFRSSSLEGEKTALGDWSAQLKYEDRSIALAVVFYYWVKAADTSMGANASAFSQFDAGYRSLPAPKALTASEGEFLDFIRVSWNPVGEATHYRVFRTDEPNGTKTAATGWQTSTEFLDTTATPGHMYYYYIRAAGDANGKGASEYSAARGGFRAHPAPTNVAASNGAFTDKIIVNWTSISGVYYYQVFRSETRDGTKLRLGDFQRMSRFEDTTAKSSTIYFYWVKAALGQSGYGSTDFSEPDWGWRTPPPPTALQASNAEYLDRIVVNWNSAAEGAYYLLTRREGTDGQMLDIGKWQTGTVYEDLDVKPGVTYYYWARAANNDKGDGASDYSNVNGGLRALDPPGGVGAMQGSETAKIAIWWKNTEGAIFYQVYRSQTEEGERVPISGWQRSIRIEDPEVEMGVVYRYWVKSAMGWTGYAASDYSETVAGWLKPLVPESIEASDGVFEDKIQIKWDYPLSGFYFQVSRSDSIEEEKTVLGSWQTDREYNDTTAKPNTLYYYWIQASPDPSGAGPSSLSWSDTGWKLPPIPGKPGNPQPADGAAGVSIATGLDWSDCSDAYNYDLMIWKAGEEIVSPLAETAINPIEAPPLLPTEQLEESAYIPERPLEYQTTYFWKIVARNRRTTTSGPIWQFTTEKPVSILEWEVY